MRVSQFAFGLIPLLMAPAIIAAVSPTATSAIRAAVADPHRSPANRNRDRYRHPVETLSFFGVRPGQTLVEFQPSGGWYMEILAPMLSGRGHYVGLVMRDKKSQDALAKLIASGGQQFSEATIATLDPATGSSSVRDGSADVVLTFRNVHNLIMSGGNTASGSFKAFYRMLKPGGELGVVDHLLPETMNSAQEMKSGYLKRSTVVRLARQAGFRLVGESRVNANPKDTHDWPKGVWTLPPSLQMGDANRAKYLAIGESDRMTLIFVKPT